MTLDKADLRPYLFILIPFQFAVAAHVSRSAIILSTTSGLIILHAAILAQSLSSQGTRLCVVRCAFSCSGHVITEIHPTELTDAWPGAKLFSTLLTARQRILVGTGIPFRILGLEYSSIWSVHIDDTLVNSLIYFPYFKRQNSLIKIK
jgi:hypothetical protein